MSITKELLLQDKKKIDAKFEELKQAALPMIKYLAENYHPHVSAIITSTSVELTEGIMNYPKIMDFIND